MKEKLNTANERIVEYEDALEKETEYSTSLLSEANEIITQLYTETKSLHTELKKSKRETATEKTKLIQAKANHTLTKSELTKAKKDITKLEAKYKNLEETIRAGEQDNEVAVAARARGSKKSTSNGAGGKKSPGTIAQEKSDIRLEEWRKREMIKQQHKERDREHVFKVKRQRLHDVTGITWVAC